MADAFLAKAPNYSTKRMVNDAQNYQVGRDDAIINSYSVCPQTGLLGFQVIAIQMLLANRTGAQIKAALQAGHPDTHFQREDKYRTMLKFSALGYPYFPKNSEVRNKGTRPFLCPEDTATLAYMCQRYEAEHDPMTRFELETRATCLKRARVNRAKLILQRCPRLFVEATELNFCSLEPPDDFYSDFVILAELQFGFPTRVDQNRLFAASPNRLSLFFTHFGPTARTFLPELVFNADEIGVDISTGRFKVISRAKAVAPTPNRVPHVSMMCCVSASGVAVPPMFILTGLGKLPAELKDFTQSAWFASSSSGWQTEITFYGWCLHFVHWASQYRSRLPANLQTRWILLVLDGHASRSCPEALALLYAHRVHVLILPSHCTHVLQPFDVALASPLRGYFNRFRRDSARLIAAIVMSVAARNRFIIVDAMMRAWGCATSLSNVRAGFRTSGIYPWDLTQPLNSAFCIAGVYNPPQRQALNLSGTMPTVPQMYQRVLAAKMHTRILWPRMGGTSIFLVDNDPVVDEDLIEWLGKSSAKRVAAGQPDADGKLLSAPDPLGIETQHGNLGTGWFFHNPRRYTNYRYY